MPPFKQELCSVCCSYCKHPKRRHSQTSTIDRTNARSNRGFENTAYDIETSSQQEASVTNGSQTHIDTINLSENASGIQCKIQTSL